MERFLCKKRAREVVSASEVRAASTKTLRLDAPVPVAHASGQLPVVVVICRGVRFETTLTTLLRLGPCYLSMQADIDTAEAIYLDYSPIAFQVVLDALTAAQLDLGKALLHVARHCSTVADLEALLQFVLLGWILGVSLPMPPAPAVATPRGDKFGEFRSGFTLRGAYQGESGVFRHLLTCAPAGNIPCRYDECAAPEVGLGTTEAYEEPCNAPRLGCVPVSIELDTFMLKKRADWDDDFTEWAQAHDRVSSIRMLQVTLERSGDLGPFVFGDHITLHAGGAAVFDLGCRRALICEGLVLGMNRTAHNTPGAHHDMLTVDMVSDLDHGRQTTRLACQPLEFDGDLITYFRLSFPKEVHRLGRMFRLRVDPFHPKVGDYIMHDDLSNPLYMLRSVELFGTLIDLPCELCPDDQLRAPFAMDEQTTRLKTRRKQPNRFSVSL